MIHRSYLLAGLLLLNCRTWGMISAESSAHKTNGIVIVENAQTALIEQVDVPTQEAGVIKAILSKEGTLVEEGDRLVQLNDTQAKIVETSARYEYEIAKTQAENDIKVRSARKSAEITKAELKRAIRSNEKFEGTVSDTELDRLRFSVERAELEIEQTELQFNVDRISARLKENEYRKAQHNRSRREIRAPLAGMVVKVLRRQGEWVKPGDTVMRILRIDRLRVEAFVEASDLTAEVVGSPVRMVVRLPGNRTQVGEGHVVFVSPEVNPVNGEVLIWAEIKNRDLKLRPGQKGTLTIGTKSASE